MGCLVGGLQGTQQGVGRCLFAERQYSNAAMAQQAHGLLAQ